MQKLTVTQTHQQITWNFTWFTWTHVSPKSEFTWNTLSLKFRFSPSTHANLKLMRDNDSWKALLPFTFIVSWFRAVSTTLSVVGKVCKIENRRKWRFRPWRSSYRLIQSIIRIVEWKALGKSFHLHSWKSRLVLQRRRYRMWKLTISAFFIRMGQFKDHVK